MGRGSSALFELSHLFFQMHLMVVSCDLLTEDSFHLHNRLAISPALL